MVMSNVSNFLCAYIRPRYQISVHSNSRLLIDISLDTCKKKYICQEFGSFKFNSKSSEKNM